MIKRIGGTAIGLIAGAMIGGIALGQQIPEVTVQASRIITKTTAAGHDAADRIVDLSLTYGVSYAGLDLTKHADVMELEKRVTDTAGKACRELNRQYPIDAQPEADCAKAAAAKSLVKVHELAAAAAQPGSK